MKIFSNTLIYNQLFNFVAQNSGKLQIHFIESQIIELINTIFYALDINWKYKSIDRGH